jgi:hypothetical protein
VAVTAEPNEYLIRRAIERLFPAGALDMTPQVRSSSQIPVIVAANLSFINEVGDNWRSEVAALISSASNFLNRECGFSLNLLRIKTDSVALRADVNPPRRFTNFLRREAPAGDTLIIGLYSEYNPEGFFGQRETDAIGLSMTGDRRMLLRQLPPGRRDDPIWRAHLNSLVLVHELGHVMGAIHVSDPLSIMCHNASWLASARFDGFNREVIRAALEGDFRVRDAKEYVRFISDRLVTSSYNLVDYPPILHRYLAGDNVLSNSKMARSLTGHKPLLKAAEAFGRLIAGHRSEAAELFAEAAREDSRQACLPYYLARATDGQASAQALQRAADLGYWHARLLLRMREKSNQDR